jgi:hypothetical protein
MLVTVVEWGWIVLGAYLAAGVVFAVPFVLRWVNRIDENAEHGSWGFRALIFPASVALWPWLARRVLGGRPQSVERNPHRDAARGAS